MSAGRGGRGRGAYYRQRYGGGCARRTDEGHFNHDSSPVYQEPTQQPAGTPRGGELKDWHRLRDDLRSIDSQQYGQYKRLLGSYNHAHPPFTLSVDHVQGDAYAAPSRVRAVVPWTETGFPGDYLKSDVRRIALCDFVSRVAGSIIQAKHLDRNVGNANGGWSGPKGGAFSINLPGQEILPRTSALISGDGQSVELRFTVALPAAGRTILGQQAWQILGVNLVEVVTQSLIHSNLDRRRLEQHITSAERQQAIRQQLDGNGLVAFVANGSILPRASGASQGPMMSAGVVKFQSPKALEITLTASDGTTFTGMGIPKGITLLTGGGFHGKSTLLEALELGIYNHIPGDGREAVVSEASSVKIKAEDGRIVSKTDISPFISKLPGGKDTSSFSSEDASGSTSMASNIQEALEAGCKTILIDEDSSATNLLVRDRRMEILIRNEPITPLISKARALYDQHGVSMVIVIGGLGDWLSVADNIIAMDSYVPASINEQAKQVLKQYPSTVKEDAKYGAIPRRTFRVDLEGLRSPFASRNKFISMNSQVKDAVDDPSKAASGVDLGGLDQIVEIGQSQTIAVLLQRIASVTRQRALSLDEICQLLDENISIEKGMPTSHTGGDLVAVRRFELAAALSRLRGLSMRVGKAS